MPQDQPLLPLPLLLSFLLPQQTLPEREARALIAQVFSGLAYLNRAPNSSSSGGGDAAGFGPRVIHYDLKPANILFDSLGTVKMTDFGLSKVSSRQAQNAPTCTGIGGARVLASRKLMWWLKRRCLLLPDTEGQLHCNAGALMRWCCLCMRSNGMCEQLQHYEHAGSHSSLLLCLSVVVWRPVRSHCAVSLLLQTRRLLRMTRPCACCLHFKALYLLAGC
jgi:serine/threonine protein kinase